MTILCLILTLINGKTVLNDENHFELTGENASVFLQTTIDESSDSDFNKRESGITCVPCAFGIYPCCEPNVCVKKSYWPDECREVKRAKPNRKPHFD